jgi:tetratricopeptide (TPR) repeat protein
LTSTVAEAFGKKDDAYVVLLPVGPAGPQSKATLSPTESQQHLRETRVAPPEDKTRPYIALNPLLEPALHQAESCEQARNLRAAEAIYQQLLQLSPCDPNVLERLARLWLQAGNAKLAISFAELASKASPERSKILQLLGEART